MDEVLKLLKELVFEKQIIYGVLSNLRKKDENSFNKVTIKPVLIKEDMKIQVTYNYN